jgi:preprotein translocase subunit SecY
MASAAEQLAANLNLGVLSKATELKKRIWFTLGALIVYRIGTYIPVPGVDATVMGQLMNQNGGGVLGMFDMFSGGALGRMTVFALNIMPYISASIIVQLMSAAIPSLESLKKEGESGRKKMNQYTRYLTVVIAIFQSYGIAVGLESMRGATGPAVIDPGMFFRLSTVVTLVGGTMFLMWIGEQITARGVGNGTSLIIFAGIVANLHGTGAETCRGAVPEAAGRHPYVRRRFDPHAAEGEYLGRYPADFRQFDPAHPSDDRGLFERRQSIDLAGLDRECPGAWPAALHGVVCRDDHLFLVFLYRRGV